MPLEIIGLGKPEVEIIWDDDDTATYGARDLRIACTCAHCQSEFTGERILDPASIPADLTIKAMGLVGNYGLSIHFSDGHTTGIYRLKVLFERRAGGMRA